MLFSIIIPTYNRPVLVRRAIQSALAQEDADVEVVVVDNSTTDDTQSVMADFDDPRVRYVHNLTNIGMVRNWAKAVHEVINGDWFLILSDDDYLVDTGYLAHAAQSIAENPCAVLVHAKRINHVVSQGRFLKCRKRLPRVVEGEWMFLNFTQRQEKTNYSFPATLFRVDIARRIGIFTRSIAVASDMMEELRMSLEGQSVFLNRYVVVYTVHSESYDHNLSDTEIMTNVEAIEIPYEAAREKGIASDKVLDRWRARQLTSFFRGAIERIYRRGRVRDIVGFFLLNVVRYSFRSAGKAIVAAQVSMCIFKQLLKRAVFFADRP